MEPREKMLRIIVVAVTAVFVFAGLIMAVAIGINIALAPVARALQDAGALSARVDALEAEVKSLAQRGPSAKAPAAPAEDFNKVYDLPVGGSHVLGKPDARVTLVDFSDFQCPYCARFYQVIEEVYKAFPDDVKVVLKDFPLGFHPAAKPAAKAALAAGLQGKYYEMAALLMASNPDNMTEEDFRAFAKEKGLDPDKYMSDLKAYSQARREGKEPEAKIELPPRKPEFSEELYKKLAGDLGLDVAKYAKDLKEQDAAFEKKIAEDVALAAKADVRGTPTFFLNGKKTRARDLAGFKAEIEKLLKK